MLTAERFVVELITAAGFQSLPREVPWPSGWRSCVGLLLGLWCGSVGSALPAPCPVVLRHRLCRGSRRDFPRPLSAGAREESERDFCRGPVCSRDVVTFEGVVVWVF